MFASQRAQFSVLRFCPNAKKATVKVACELEQDLNYSANHLPEKDHLIKHQIYIPISMPKNRRGSWFKTRAFIFPFFFAALPDQSFFENFSGQVNFSGSADATRLTTCGLISRPYGICDVSQAAVRSQLAVDKLRPVH